MSDVADTAVADTAVADSAVADTAVADTEVADTAVADTTVADTAVADTTLADTAIADTAVADTTVADTAVADTAVADTAVADASDGAVDPFSLSARCTSGTLYTSGANPSMAPGRSCRGCHDGSSASDMIAGGTVYPTGHEPDNCNGIAGNANVVMTDGAGHTVTMAVNAAGNFSLLTPAPAGFAPPFTVKVQTETRTREMLTPISNGDCNACHTQNGASGAPGRVVLP
jgi:hypothetical protein